jgi:acyl dehydratase
MTSMLTYAKAAVPLLPGASRLPFVAGGGHDMPPDLERTREGVAIDGDHLAAYNRVCGFGLRDTVPGTYPHVLAFPLHMSLLTDGRFPFPAIGLVHIANRITVHRPVRTTDTLDLRVTATPVESHPAGRAFTIVTEARVGDALVWEGHSTNLRRGDGSGERKKSRGKRTPPAFNAEWRLPGDLGRRYGSVSGDQNPIHLHPLTARLFGFPRAIAHGMWTKARCLAALDSTLPESYTVRVEFKKPILLPSRVVFGSDGTRFGVRAADKEDVVHLEGTVSS